MVMLQTPRGPTGTLFPQWKLGRDHTIAKPDLAEIGNLRIGAMQRRKLGGDNAIAEPDLAGVGDLRVRPAQRRKRNRCLGCHFFLLVGRATRSCSDKEDGKLSRLAS